MFKYVYKHNFSLLCFLFFSHRKSFLKLSSSPEAFVALRTRFATSHAALCIAQWILGIGDRHLGNFLVDKSSGYEIGIDFGHAFGSATQVRYFKYIKYIVHFLSIFLKLVYFFLIKVLKYMKLTKPRC